MMTVTCRLSRGEVSTGIRWVTGGLEPPIICTSSTNPVMSSPAGSAISCLFTNNKVMTQMLNPNRFIESKLPAIGTCPPAIHRRINSSAKKLPSNATHTIAVTRSGLYSRRPLPMQMSDRAKTISPKRMLTIANQRPVVSRL